MRNYPVASPLHNAWRPCTRQSEPCLFVLACSKQVKWSAQTHRPGATPKRDAA